MKIEEESSFLDNDAIPIYGDPKPEGGYVFSGKRVKRGLYKTKSGKLINGAANILVKSNNILGVEKRRQVAKGVLSRPTRWQLYC